MALSADQRRNAAIIVSVGRQLGASSRDILIALMAAMQESGLRSGLGEARSDRDSAGLFQQRRPWAPGGSESYRLNPVNAARMFFLGGAGGQRGLFDFRNRGRMSLGAAAQAVQVSAYPGRYARHESVARSLLGAGGGGVGRAAAAKLGGGGFMRPVQSGRMSQEYGRPNAWYSAGYHTGVDFSAPKGTPVFAAGAGRVVNVGAAGRYGNRVEIEHGGKLWTLYAHLSGINVRKGQTVQAGQRIGAVGNTGGSGRGTMGFHLHFEFRQGANKYRNTVNPMKFINGSTTPNAYIDRTTTVPLEVTQDPAALMAQTAGVATQPYVYVNPVDLLTEPVGPIGGVDPLAQFGPSDPLPAEQEVEQPVVEMNPLAPPILEGVR